MLPDWFNQRAKLKDSAIKFSSLLVFKFTYWVKAEAYNPDQGSMLPVTVYGELGFSFYTLDSWFAD